MANPRLTKSQLITTLATETNTDKKTAIAFLDAVVAIAYSETKKKGEFVIPGIGKLVKQKRKARIGVNPKTGAKIKIAAKTVVKFRLAKAAKDAVFGAEAPKKAAPAKPAAKTVVKFRLAKAAKDAVFGAEAPKKAPAKPAKKR